ncbi:hypothetical protein [Botrimarina mediterranea]|uniref:Uncharacterized protein n=1 Tax=Botrimarina mediterranea TaxID=2528022 RepID=A0A518K284_9BACT|nr:hypothetical protein [Botrimarina mediterranea]QDV71924.1 hypothetical protein Spa11_00930 [Botrimarina mediterranea]QDV76465.1 hypothetical protein K2D_00430 [Planctomycetes bacterium K2D]
MAIYVGIWKINEDDQYATYEFGPNEDRVGVVRVAKEDGSTEVITEVPDDEKRAYSPCARRKLLLHWRKQEFPDKTCFAS